MSKIDKTLSELAARLPGKVFRPSDADFQTATEIWNVSAVSPKAIVRCTSTADVQASVRIAYTAGIPLSVKSGGHDWAGRALCEGLVIDLGAMNEVEVNSHDRSHARIGGGALASDVARRTDPLGVAAVLGSVGAVGFGGLTLGGGYGPMITHFGLASDSVVGAEVVLANGSVVIADENRNQDLLWALRGGGGNFGIVTSLSVRLHAVPSLHCGIVIYPQAQAEGVIKRLEAMAADFTDELTYQLAFTSAPDGQPVLAVVPYWSGAPTLGESQTTPFRELGDPIHSDISRRSFSEALGLYDGPITDRHHVFMDSCWVEGLSPDVAEMIIRQGARRPAPGCTIITHEFRGAAARVPAEATAFGFRQPHVLIELVVQHDDSEGAAERAWAAETMAALGSMALPGAYANFLTKDDRRASDAFGPNAARLADLKRRYDPNNLLRSAIPLPFD